MFLDQSALTTNYLTSLSKADKLVCGYHSSSVKTSQYNIKMPRQNHTSSLFNQVTDYTFQPDVSLNLSAIFDLPDFHAISDSPPHLSKCRDHAIPAAIPYVHATKQVQSRVQFVISVRDWLKIADINFIVIHNA